MIASGVAFNRRMRKECILHSLVLLMTLCIVFVAPAFESDEYRVSMLSLLLVGWPMIVLVAAINRK